MAPRAGLGSFMVPLKRLSLEGSYPLVQSEAQRSKEVALLPLDDPRLVVVVAALTLVGSELLALVGATRVGDVLTARKGQEVGDGVVEEFAVELGHDAIISRGILRVVKSMVVGRPPFYLVLKCMMVQWGWIWTFGAPWSTYPSMSIKFEPIVVYCNIWNIFRNLPCPDYCLTQHSDYTQISPLKKAGIAFMSRFLTGIPIQLWSVNISEIKCPLMSRFLGARF